jgi:hypothetical protein
MKNPQSFKFILFSFVIFASSVSAFADVKIKSKQTVAGQTSESTVYIKDKRQRTESADGASVTILQCDLRRSVQLMPQAQAFMITQLDHANDDTTTTAVDKNTTKTVTKGGTVTVTVTSKDTGERKQMFGYQARHIITTIETVSSPDACTPIKNKMQQDGWYIDAAFALSCASDRYKNSAPESVGGCTDKYINKQIGTARRGFPLLEKMTMFDDADKETFSMTSEVVELSKQTLNAALFDVPAGFSEVKNASDLSNAMAAKLGGAQIGGNQMPVAMSSGAMPAMPGMPNGVGNGGGNYGAGETSGLSASIKNLGNKTSNAATSVGEKKAGTVRIGLAGVKSGAVGEGMNASELAAAIGNTLAEYLTAPNVEVVRLEARLASQIEGEAERKACDFVVYANVSHKKGGGGFGKMFGSVSPMLGNVIPVAGGMGSAIGGAVASTVITTAASASANVKPKDELTLDIKMQNGANVHFTKQYKAKAKSEGEDIITPLIEQAAQAIVDAIAK